MIVCCSVIAAVADHEHVHMLSIGIGLNGSNEALELMSMNRIASCSQHSAHNVLMLSHT